jgi:hypothetical protein
MSGVLKTAVEHFDGRMMAWSSHSLDLKEVLTPT